MVTALRPRLRPGQAPRPLAGSSQVRGGSVQVGSMGGEGSVGSIRVSIWYLAEFQKSGELARFRVG